MMGYSDAEFESVRSGAGSPSPEKHRDADPKVKATFDYDGNQMIPVRNSTKEMTRTREHRSQSPEVESTEGNWRYRSVRGSDFWEHFGIEDGEQLTGAEYDNLMKGLMPDGSEPDHRTRADDMCYRQLTFSAPKSVSLTQFDEDLSQEERDAVLQAHQAAVDEAEAKIREDLNANDREGKTADADIGSIVYDESINANGEPHLHSHAILPNHAIKEDGTIRAVDTQNLQFRIKEWGQYYRDRLRHQIENHPELDLDLTHRLEDEAGFFELERYDPEMVTDFSSRRAEIVEQKKQGKSEFEALYADRDNEYSDLPDRDTLAEQLKNEVTLRNQADQERRTWDEFNRDRLESMDLKYSLLSDQSDSELSDVPNMNLAVHFAVDRLTEESNTFNHSDLRLEIRREAARREMDAPSNEEIDERIEHAIEQNTLYYDEESEAYTTPETILREHKIHDATETERDGERFFSDEAVNELENMTQADWEEEFDFAPSESQKGMLTQTLRSNRQVIGVAAQAGAGKTSTAEKLEHWAKKHGVNTVGLATARKATAELEAKASMEADTVYQYLQQHEDDDVDRPSQLVVIDEASMVNTKDLHRVIDVAEEHDDQVLLVGDPAQLPSVGAGGDFERILENQSEDEIIRMDDNYRQQNERIKQTVEVARDSESESLAMLATDGRITQEDGFTERARSIAQEYIDDPDGTMVITGKNREVDAFNLAIREELQNQGMISRDEAHHKIEEWRDRDSLRIAKGDTLVPTRNLHDMEDVFGDNEITINKDTEMTVVNVKENGVDVEVQTPTGETHTIPLNQEEFEDGLPVNYGYAGTVHKAQGQDAETVIWHADTSDPIPRSAEYYVAVSRAQNDIQVYTDDLKELRNQVENEQVKSSSLEHFDRPFSAEDWNRDLTLDRHDEWLPRAYKQNEIEKYGVCKMDESEQHEHAKKMTLDYVHDGDEKSYRTSQAERAREHRERQNGKPEQDEGLTKEERIQKAKATRKRTQALERSKVKREQKEKRQKQKSQSQDDEQEQSDGYTM